MNKQYLGDSVYIDIEQGIIKLTTENGYGPSNTIFLELEVYNQLIEYVERAKTIHKAHIEMDKDKS